MLVQITKERTTEKFHVFRKLWDGCTDCELCKTRSQLIHFRGTLPAPVLFVGHSPSYADNESGLPISGDPGRLLDEMIHEAATGAAIGHFDYAVVNLVACYTPSRVPFGDQIEACRSRFVNLIRYCQPKLIVTLGVQTRHSFPRSVLRDARYASLAHPESLLRASCIEVLRQRVNQWIVALSSTLDECLNAQAA